MELRAHIDQGRALLDTGFEGDLAIPVRWLDEELGLPDAHIPCELADGSIVDAPVYLGTLELVGLESIPDVAIIMLGDEYILGRGIMNRYRVIFDHGQRVIVEP